MNALPPDSRTDEAALLARRADFPILAKSTYLISHSLGAMHRGVFDSMREYATMWAERGIRSWAEGWWAMPGSTGDVLCDILDAPHGSIVMQQNVSLCQSIVASCFDYRPPRNKIVYTSLNFPTVMYVWEARARDGAVIREVASPDGMTVPTELLLDAIDEQTLLVPISHVLYKSAWLQDAKAIIAKAHSVGAMVVLDCYQSAGTVPFSLRDLEVDFACGGSVKWLCGGPGAGWLYVRPDLRPKFEPRVTGWMAHRAPFDFVPGPIEYAETNYRFLHGSPAVPAMFAALPGYKTIREIGVAAIRRKSQRQTELLRGEAAERGLRVTSPEDPARRGGTITVDPTPLLECGGAGARATVSSATAVLDDRLGAAVVKTLAQREILVDFRPGAGIRVSPHFYNSDDELRLCLDQIVEIVKTRAFEKHQGGAAY
ncbi:MAG: aminotransferase class V-fold PLP-dependent enzyme [Planctomycetes bacterium]|nr:aminotransferase class V-fold PLP-dependent enzyme [Planctomycetota bacterium]